VNIKKDETGGGEKRKICVHQLIMQKYSTQGRGVHFFAEKCTLPLPDNNLRNPSPALLLLLSPLNKPMSITYFEEIKRPFNSSGTQSLGFMREREIW
jgi:hypothetical protein